MTDNVDTQDQGSEGGALRRQLEEALRELGQYKAKERRETIAEVLRGKGYDPAAAALVQSQVKDPDGVEAWLAENGKFLAKAQPAEDPQGPPAKAPDQPPAPNPAVEQLRQFAQSTPPQAPPPGSFQDRVSQAQSLADLDKVLKASGFQGSIL